MNLVETPDNRPPPGAEIVPVRTADGVILRAVIWRPQAREARGTILLMQGRAEFVEKYFEVVGDVLRRGFAVAAFDWRGQGQSGESARHRHRGHIRRFADFRHDLDAVAAAVLPGLPRPVTALAHSMGGCIALDAASEGRLPASRLVASTPMLGLSLVRHPRVARTVARSLAALGLSARMVPGGETRSISLLPFAGNRLTSDEARYRRNAAAALAVGDGAIGSPTIGWIAAAYEAMERLAAEGFGARIRIPVLVVGAGNDPVCSTPAAERFARDLAAGSYLPLPDARHEVMMERDAVRELFWAGFDAFVKDAASGSAGERLENGVMQARVATGHDRASPGR